MFVTPACLNSWIIFYKIYMCQIEYILSHKKTLVTWNFHKLLRSRNGLCLRQDYGKTRISIKCSTTDKPFSQYFYNNLVHVPFNIKFENRQTNLLCPYKARDNARHVAVALRHDCRRRKYRSRERYFRGSVPFHTLQCHNI